jgi:hypothetical protein
VKVTNCEPDCSCSSDTINQGSIAKYVADVSLREATWALDLPESFTEAHADWTAHVRMNSAGMPLCSSREQGLIAIRTKTYRLATWGCKR